MNILIVPSWYESKPGAQLGSFFREQALLLMKSGENVIIADATFQNRTQGFSSSNLKVCVKNDEGLKTYSYVIPPFGLTRLPSGGLSIYLHHLEKILLKTIKNNERVEVIHAHSFFPAGIAATRLGKKYGIPVVVTEHSSSVLIKNLTKTKEKYLIETVRDSSAFLAVSHKLKRSICDYTSYGKKIKVIPNVVDERFSTKSKKKLDNMFIFTTIGNLVYSKRFDLVINAFANCFKGYEHIKLNIVGDGVLRKELYQMAKKNGVENQICFCGRVSRDEVTKILHESDAFVLASDYETFGVVYIEAMACGLPVIGTKNGGAEEIISDENGILINTDSVLELEYAFKKIQANISSYDSNLISEKTIQRYGKDTVISALLEVYKSVLRGRK